jgi:small ligand-binding sensory domain FIST
MAITEAEGNVIHELASRPALERLRQAIAELEPTERGLAAEGLLVGIVVDPNKPDYARGDFQSAG